MSLQFLAMLSTLSSNTPGPFLTLPPSWRGTGLDNTATLRVGTACGETTAPVKRPPPAEGCDDAPVGTLFAEVGRLLRKVRLLRLRRKVPSAALKVNQERVTALAMFRCF